MQDLKTQLVIARYNENINWALPYIDKAVIYNKGLLNIPKVFNIINLPNFGREGHTYLYHIITNYDNLAEKTLFFQGKIDDHQTIPINDYFNDSEELIAKFSVLSINELKQEINHGKKWRYEKESGSMRATKYTPYNWLVDLIGIDIDKTMKEFNVIWGANFSVSKKLIQSKPKIFYQNILRYLDFHKNPEEGHFLERVWTLIFLNKHINKPVINSYYIKNIDDINLNKYNSSQETHLWLPNFSNQSIYKNFKICLIPPYSSFFEIKPDYKDNKFSLSLSNYVHLKIIFSSFSNIDNYNYEIILNNKHKSVIKLINTPNIIESYSGLIFNKKLLKLDFSIEDNKFIVKNEDKIIFNIDHKNEINTHTPIFLIKNISDEELLIDYNVGGTSTSTYDHKNIKLFIFNNSYENNLQNFYYYNYLDNYIEQSSF